MLITPSPWTEVAVNGLLADSEVEDFGRAEMVANPLLVPPLDYVLCLSTIEYGGAASVVVRLFFAQAVGAAAENQKEIVDQDTQYFIWPAVTVPRNAAGLPWTMRISKAATNANIGYRYEWRRPGSC